MNERRYGLDTVGSASWTAGMTPARFANYPGDCTHMVGEVKGPNRLGELLTAVSAVYDPTSDSTRVGFVYGHCPTCRATWWRAWRRRLARKVAGL